MTRILQTTRLTLRPYTADDQNLLADLYADTDVTATTKLGQLNNQQADVILQEYLATWRKTKFGMYAGFLRSTEEYVGEAGLFDLENCEHLALRYVIHKRHWGQGLAFEAAAAVTGHVFQQGHGRILTFVEGPNQASHQIVLKLGFTMEKPCRYPRASCIDTG